MESHEVEIDGKTYQVIQNGNWKVLGIMKVFVGKIHPELERTFDFAIPNPQWENCAHYQGRRSHFDGGERVLCYWNFRLHRKRIRARWHGMLALHEELWRGTRPTEVKHRIWLLRQGKILLFQNWNHSSLELIRLYWYSIRPESYNL